MPAPDGGPARRRDEVRRIEEPGLDSVSISDHLIGGWSMNRWLSHERLREKIANLAAAAPIVARLAER